ncbi:MAG: hypothetical protein ACI857_003191 [Arenicella sp.]|jgi:uncharacterized protein (TIGR02453 family)
MAHLSKDYMDFFKELAADNSKNWFDINRKRYKDSVKDPFDKFIGDLIDEVKKIDNKIEIAPKDAVFRINRDIRFSKDKTPYKLNRSAIISPKGRKDKAYPGLYIEVSPEHCRVYGGVYQPDKTQLYNIRETIVDNPSKLNKLMNDKEFKSTFGDVKGEKNKVIPKEFKEVAAKHEIVLNKQFYWYTEMKPAEALKDGFLDKVLTAYKTNKKIMDYFADAMS